MEIAMGALGPLLPKLGELLAGEYTLEKRVRKGIESLMRELTFIHAALLEVAKVPADQLGEGVKVWAGNVKELSYQMEDIVDAFVVRVENGDEPADPKNRIKKLIKRTTKLFKKGRDLHGISDAIEEAVGQAKELAELRRRYECEMRTTGAGDSVDPRMAALYTDVTELVGIDEKRDELMAMLTEGDDWSKRPLKTVSIVGFGGLGKTTLAKTVYDKIKVQFDCTAFVSVSRNPDMKKVLKDILYELDKIKYTDVHPSRDAKQLIDMLVEFLKDKRYLIIIDDIWDEDAWRLIKCAFSNSSPGSRIITTTRIASVSEACCSSNDDIYKMKPLSDDVSRSLFYKRIFTSEKGCPSELVQVSEEILKKCGGIPLAIITMASLLAINRQMKTKEQWYSWLNSIGHGLTRDRTVEEMKKILLLSYYDLPSYLKPCLLYLSIYPEDYMIMRHWLIWRWIAEGFVHSEMQETSLYELGERYFNELVNRSMIQPMGIDDELKVKACRVHDMVFELICSLSSEENFVTIVDGTEEKVHKSRGKVRRLSIQKSKKVDVPTTNMPQVRSLIAFTNDIVDLVPLISRFQVLRVLDLQGCTISDLVYVEKLLHLRYLGLKSANVCKLPMQIGNLHFLQTMDLRQANSIKELPSSFVRLRRLMCLYVHVGMKVPSGMDKLMSLEVLHGLLVGQLSPDICNLDIVKELGHLTKLRVLKFIWKDLDKSMDEALVESLSNLRKLQCLHIRAEGGRVDLMREGWVSPPDLRRLQLQGQTCSFLTLPAWINPSSLPLLSNLDIYLDQPRPEDIRLLGTLPSLRYLWLGRDWEFLEERAVEMSAVTADAFPCATECYFRRIAGVPSIFPRGAAPRLKRLEFGFPATWISRGDIDLRMGHLPSLEEVNVDLFRQQASNAEMIEAEAALRAAADDHPNRPTCRINIWW